MPNSNRKIRIFYAITAMWSIACLLLTERVSYAFFKSDNVVYLVGVWLISSLFPAVSVLWLWIMERSPWDRKLLIPVAAMGVFFFIAFFITAINPSGRYFGGKIDDVAFVAGIWSTLAYFNAWLLEEVTSVDALNWKRIKPIPETSVTIDHDKYLRLLSNQELSGFPSVMRVQQHFSTTLPECIPAFTDYGPIPNQHIMNEELSHARTFMLSKVSCELTFLCAMSFLERMCGPDFQYTKQYQSLTKRMLEIDAVPDDGPFEGLSLSRKAITESDLEAVKGELEKRRESARVQAGSLGSDTDVTIALAAMTLLIKEGLLNPKDVGDDFNSDFTRMVKGGMNKIRETFSRQKTDIGLQT